MISTILAKIGLPVLVDVLMKVLGSVDNPVAKSAEKALKDVEIALENGGISVEQLKEAHRHTEDLLKMQIEENSSTLSEINKTIREEVTSSDKYVRRMRPTFGYIMAITWSAQMLGLAYVIIFKTENAPFVLNAMASLGAIWGIGLSVLGIYVYKRSEDKKLVSSSDENETIFWAAKR